MIESSVSLLYLEDLAGALMNLEGVVGRKWLEGEWRAYVERGLSLAVEDDPSMPLACHPIAWLWYTAWDQFNYFRDHEAVVGGELLQAAFLGTALAQAHTFAPDGLDYPELVRRLKEAPEALQTAYELEVASAFRERGYAVRFPLDRDGVASLTVLREARERLLCCRRRDRTSPRDRQCQAAWSSLRDALTRWMTRTRRSVSLTVEAKRDPVVAEIQPLVTFLVERLAELAGGEAWDPSGVYHLRWRGRAEPEGTEFIPPADPEGPQAGSLDEGIADFIDVPVILRRPDGTTEAVRFVGRAAEEPDRVQGIGKRVEEAGERMPPGARGIVSLEVPSRTFESDIARAAGRIQEYLDRSESVSTVLVTTRRGQGTEEGTFRLSRVVRAFTGPGAKSG